MTHRVPFLTVLILASFILSAGPVSLSGRQSPDPLAGFKPPALALTDRALITGPGRFSGYTNYWHSLYWDSFQYGNLFQMSLPDVAKSVLQNKVDMAEELGIPGLRMMEGFLDGLLSSPYQELNDPEPDALARSISRSKSHLLVYDDASSECGRRLGAALASAPDELTTLTSHQFNAAGFKPVHLFYLVKDARRIFAVLSDDPAVRSRLKDLIRNAESVVRKFDFHRGWFATGTLLHSVTCFPGHPLEVIAEGLSQGNDWFTFNGYMDYLLKKQLPEWLSKAGLDIVADVGSAKSSKSLGTLGFGLSNWDGFKIQDTPKEDDWITFVKKRGGFIFRPVFSAECDSFAYDGMIAVEGNKKQIDAENVPFILPTGMIREDAPPCMILFTDKGTAFDRKAMYRAILDRREVGILPLGKMLGPAMFRRALQMLLLDRIYLERRFGDQVRITAAAASPNRLEIQVTNAGRTPLAGTLVIQPPSEISIRGERRFRVTVPAGDTIFKTAEITTSLAATGRVNPIQVSFEWDDGKKATLAVLDLPRPISVHQLLYGQSPDVEYPVSIYNFGKDSKVPVEMTVVRQDASSDKVYETRLVAQVPPCESRELQIKLPLPPGRFRVRVKALGAENWSQLGVEGPSGQAIVTEVDLNGDGLNEVRMENDRVRVTLLAIGARIIEYIVKDKNDNIFFKLWPEKEKSTDRKPFRERGFYPYGGFEDFLGQASIETHKVYGTEILKKSGPYVQVRMRADYYGNALEKIFTLYGNSPLVEVRFALNFRNPELNMLGPQPILELGKRHWTEDAFFVPTTDGIQEFRMRPEEYYGRVLYLKEGWNAGRDTEEDIAFVGAFPVGEPEFLHMWMNHPVNQESNHYYAEFQPWVPIDQKTVRYFSYYIWGAAGDWKSALEELRKRNLITSK